jgi:hypothetical protein
MDDANGQDVHVGNIKNAYLCAFMQKKVWTKCGLEFAKAVFNMSGCIALLVKALYGLKSIGQAWHRHLADVY